MTTPPPIDYANYLPKPRRYWPWWFAPLSLGPTLLLVLIITGPNRLRDWIRFFGDRERSTGELWILVALWSIASLILLLRRAKPAHVWVCIALHIAFLLLTIFPGFIVISWLLHWTTGPGA